ncbi:hypothetical protein QE152_g33461 [Popillia japonica]|uniref:Uncharacterized protein n=1 Tax=Popillia japonica TaxID=7064 RepID=A0AAW1IX74_POPJA
MAHSRNVYKLMDMTDEDAWALLNSVPTDDENTDVEDDIDYNGDDSIANPDYDANDEDGEDGVRFEEPGCESDSEVPNISQFIASEVLTLSENEPCIPSMPVTLDKPAETFCRHRKRSRLRSPEPTEEEDGPSTPTATFFTGNVQALTNDCREFKSIAWRKKHLQLHVNEIVFSGEKVLPPTLKELNSP